MSLALATRTLVEPTVWSTPHGERWRPQAFRTYGPEVCEVLAAADYAPDPQQELLLDLTFAVKADGHTPECFEVAAEATRRNLKTGWLIGSMIGFVHVLEVPEVMYTAHEMATAHETQREVARVMLSSALLRRRMKVNQKNNGIYEGKADERIELRTGQTLWFKTRTNDAGRGIGKPKLLLDEWYAGKASQVGALGPIMATFADSQILYASSAPKADSHELHDLLRRGEEGDSPTLALVAYRASREQCADPECRHPKNAYVRGIDCALDREHLIREGNPTITTGRITLQTLRNLRQVLPPKEYARECMGWGEAEKVPGGTPAIDTDAWDDLENPKAKKPRVAALYLDVSPDRRWSSIGVAAQGKGGRTLLLVRRFAGTAGVVEELLRLRRKRNIVRVGLHPRSQAQVLLTEIRDAGLTVGTKDEDDVYAFTSLDLGEGCSGLVQAVADGEVEHAGQTELHDAVTNAVTRNNGEAELWDRRDPEGADISGVVAVSGARLLWERHAADDYDIEDSLL